MSRGHEAGFPPGADYADLRWETVEETYLHLTPHMSEYSGRTLRSRGLARVFDGGRKGESAYLSPRSADKALRQARSLAGVGAPHYRTPVPARVVVDTVAQPRAGPMDVRNLTMEDRRALVHAIAEKLTPHLRHFGILYRDQVRRTVFTNSEGTRLEQEEVHSSISLCLFVVGRAIQRAHMFVAAKGTLPDIAALEREIQEFVPQLVADVSAPPVPSGTYDMVLDAWSTGVLVHEAFGHLSETDLILRDGCIPDFLRTGLQVASEGVRIVDDPSCEQGGAWCGSYRYDDEGVPAVRTVLVENGVLVGRLHSRETAALCGESPTSNGRAAGPGLAPRVRMSCTYLDTGPCSPQELIASTGRGVYVRRYSGGSTEGGLFRLSNGLAYLIEDGVVTRQVKAPLLFGNPLQLLSRIDMVGNDLVLRDLHCVKAGEPPIMCTTGGPHIRVRGWPVEG